MEANDQTIEGILKICMNEQADNMIRLSAATFLKTTFSKIYNVSTSLILFINRHMTQSIQSEETIETIMH